VSALLRFKDLPMEDRFVDQDPVGPVTMEHRCEELFSGDRLEQRYNYIVYHFDCDGAYFWARTYLDDVKTVSLFGPFENRTTMKPIDGSFDAAVLAYLRRRFRNVQTLLGGQYTPI
jgi:hypothetical protein